MASSSDLNNLDLSFYPCGEYVVKNKQKTHAPTEKKKKLQDIKVFV